MGHSHSWSSQGSAGEESVEEGDHWSSVNNRGHHWGSNSGSNGINKSILIEILRESLQSQRSESLGSGHKISNSWGQRSRHWSIIDIGSSTSSNQRSSNWSSGNQDLGISLSFSLVESVNSLVAVSRQGSSISRGSVGVVDIGVVVAISITIGSIVVQGVGFRLSQAERGYGENYDHALHRVVLLVV